MIMRDHKKDFYHQMLHRKCFQNLYSMGCTGNPSRNFTKNSFGNRTVSHSMSSVRNCSDGTAAGNLEQGPLVFPRGIPLGVRSGITLGVPAGFLQSSTGNTSRSFTGNPCRAISRRSNGNSSRGSTETSFQDFSPGIPV